MFRKRIINKISKYRFELSHITIFFAVLILFQIAMVFVQKSTLNDFLSQTQDWYKKYSAERLAIVTTTSMELLFENLFLDRSVQQFNDTKIIYSFNVIFKQQLIQRTVEDIFLVLLKNNRLYIIDSGQKLDLYLKGKLEPYNLNNKSSHWEGVNLFLSVKEQMKSSEVIYSTLKNKNTFNILVPFVPDGEYMGVMYLKISPDFSSLTDEIKANFDKVSLIYSALILFGLIAIFFVSSEAVKERNEAQNILFDEHAEHLKKQIKSEKESLFTKRIYHTHHKDEKIMGFIKEDVRKINTDNIIEMKDRVITYSNFISRIIYDMKWFDQEISTILNPMFHTDINKVIRFIVKHVFLRVSSKNDMFHFELDLDDTIPIVHVNEFIIWEVLEPLIQNSIDHGNRNQINILISTKYNKEENETYIIIADDGVGIVENLLMTDENGIKKIFLENESTKTNEGFNSGYGCFIAYQMAFTRCGWKIDAENLSVGCKFTIKIKN